MRNNATKIVKVFENCDTMNDSVVICEPNTPILKKSPRLKNVNCGLLPPQCTKFPKQQNLNNNSPNKQIRTPLRTVYEAAPDSGDSGYRTPTIKKIKKSKRSRVSQNGFAQPPRKKLKPSVNETIVILSDDEEEPPIERAEVIIVDETTPEAVKPIFTPRRSERQALIAKRKCLRAALSKDIEAQDDEELSVVWSSAHSEPPDIVDTPPETTALDSSLYFFDVEGSTKNFDKAWLKPTSTTDVPHDSAVDNDQGNCESTDQLPKPAQPIDSPPKVKKTKDKIKKSKPVKLLMKDKLRRKAGKGPGTGSLREIIIDGCNVAFGYTHNKEFSRMGLELVLNFFLKRGHTVKIFLPQHHRKRDREYLEEWYTNGLVVFTPSRHIGGKAIVPYDDRFILNYATKCKGIVVSSDQFRDLWYEKAQWRETIEKRLLTPTFAGDYVMFPEDPLGRSGPSLDEFLSL